MGCDAALRAAVLPAVLSKKACTGKPVGVGVCVCDGVTLGVCVALGVVLGVCVCEAVWLGVALCVGDTLGLWVSVCVCERLCEGLAAWLRVKDGLGDPEVDPVPDWLGLPVAVCE